MGLGVMAFETVKLGASTRVWLAVKKRLRPLLRYGYTYHHYFMLA